MKEKILAYVKDNRLFVSVIAVLMVIFCFFLWMTCGAGNSMEAGDVLYRCDSFVNPPHPNKAHSLFLRRLPSQRLKEVKRISQK